MNAIVVGEVVEFVDQYSVHHNALVTAIHGYFTKQERDEHYIKQYESAKAAGAKWAETADLQQFINTPFNVPSLNIIYVVPEESKQDSYGRQIAHATSVPHESSQAAHGYYWK